MISADLPFVLVLLPLTQPLAGSSLAGTLSSEQKPNNLTPSKGPPAHRRDKPTWSQPKLEKKKEEAIHRPYSTHPGRSGLADTRGAASFLVATTVPSASAPLLSSHLVEALDRACPAGLELYGLHPADLPLPHVNLQRHLLLRDQPLQRSQVRPAARGTAAVQGGKAATEKRTKVSKKTKTPGAG